MKICPKCKINKDESEFHKNKNKSNNLFWICKDCAKQYYKNISYPRKLIGTKTCYICKIEKSVSEFSSKKRAIDGLCGYCRVCKPIYKYKENNIIVNQKTCKSCNIIKNISDFQRAQTTRDGYRHKCRECRNKEATLRLYPRKLIGTKTCTKCKLELSVDEFNTQRSRPDGLSFMCSNCSNVYVKKFQTPEKTRNATLKRKYGITLNDYKEMYKKHNGKCSICSKEYPLLGNREISSLNVDHCHTTKNVRGLLCKDCNLIIGFAKDNTETLKSAISYLNKHKIKQAYNTNSII